MKYNFTKGFFGANGVTKRTGFTTPEIKEAMIKQLAMERCQQKFVLADASKFGQMSAITFSPFNAATILTENVTQEEYKNLTNIMEVRRR